MICARHGEVDLWGSVHDSVLEGGHIHFLSCGCKGNAAQLRDPDYDPNPPSAESVEVANLTARVAEHLETIAGHEAAAEQSGARIRELEDLYDAQANTIETFAAASKRHEAEIERLKERLAAKPKAAAKPKEKAPA